MREAVRSWWRAVKGTPPLDPRVVEFRAAVVAATRGPLDPQRLGELAGQPSRLGLPDEDVELEVEMLQAAQDLLALEAQVQAQGLPAIPHQHKALGAERCHFVASASLVAIEGDRPGRLFMTERRLVFLAAPLVTMSWSAVSRVADEGRDLFVIGHTRPDGLRIRCNSISDARCGRWLSDRLRSHGPDPTRSDSCGSAP